MLVELIPILLPHPTAGKSAADEQPLLLSRNHDAIATGMRAYWLLLSSLIAGCHVLTPMPGHITQNVTESKMEVVLEQHLKTGMSVSEVCAFLAKEDFSIDRQELIDSESSRLYLTRREQSDFWVHRDWTITLECKNNQLQHYSIKSTMTGP